jgi:hypothetical protein
MEEVKDAMVESNLSLLESFSLYVWSMWRGGCFSAQQTARLLGFLDRLGAKETLSFCFDELKALKESEVDAYNGAFDENFVKKEE